MDKLQQIKTILFPEPIEKVDANGPYILCDSVDGNLLGAIVDLQYKRNDIVVYQTLNDIYNRLKQVRIILES